MKKKMFTLVFAANHDCFDHGRWENLRFRQWDWVLGLVLQAVDSPGTLDNRWKHCNIPWLSPITTCTEGKALFSKNGYTRACKEVLQARSFFIPSPWHKADSQARAKKKKSVRKSGEYRGTIFAIRACNFDCVCLILLASLSTFIALELEAWLFTILPRQGDSPQISLQRESSRHFVVCIKETNSSVSLAITLFKWQAWTFASHSRLCAYTSVIVGLTEQKQILALVGKTLLMAG